jgi:hypothetical protein
LINSTSSNGSRLQVNGDIFLPQQANIWFGNNADSGSRLRLHLAADNNSYVDYATGDLNFRVGTTTRFTFQSNGGFLMSIPTFRSSGAFSFITTSEAAQQIRVGSLLVSSDYNDNTLVPTNGAYIKGVIRGADDIIAYYSSDKRLKDNVEPIKTPLDKISKIGGYSFEWNDKQETYEGKDFGVIAQEIEEIMPEIVTTRDNGYKAVKYEKLIPLLIESIKELKSELDKLKSNI